MNQAPKRPSHQGELLHSLYLWSGLSQEKFAAKFGMSRPWLQQNFKKKKLYKKTVPAICRAFNITIEYFEGNYELPKEPMSLVAEPQSPYKTEIDLLREENIRLKNELLGAYRKIEELREYPK